MSGWDLEPVVGGLHGWYIYKWAATMDRDNFDDFTALNANFLYSNLLCLLLCYSMSWSTWQYVFQLIVCWYRYDDGLLKYVDELETLNSCGMPLHSGKVIID
jgi:hypothetical protein